MAPRSLVVLIAAPVRIIIHAPLPLVTLIYSRLASIAPNMTIVKWSVQNARFVCKRPANHSLTRMQMAQVGGSGTAVVFCTTCTNRYHVECLDPRLSARQLPPAQVCALEYCTIVSSRLQDNVNALRLRAGWQCADCRLCRQCGYPEDSTNKMVTCEACDKSWHINCAQPQLTSVPKQTWKCKVGE